MGEGPTLATARLQALPLTIWNAGFVADELATAVPSAPGPGDLRAVLRQRAGAAAAGVLTWVLRTKGGAAVGLLWADVAERHAVVEVMVGRQYRRCGFGAEALRALAGWIESFLILPVAALLPPEDHAAERLALATGFVRTDGAENGRQLWVRPRLD